MVLDPEEKTPDGNLQLHVFVYMGLGFSQWQAVPLTCPPKHSQQARLVTGCE